MISWFHWSSLCNKPQWNISKLSYNQNQRKQNKEVERELNKARDTDLELSRMPIAMNTGIPAEDVAKLIETVVESTKAGIPVEAKTLGLTGANIKEIPDNLIQDLIKDQK